MRKLTQFRWLNWVTFSNIFHTYTSSSRSYPLLVLIGLHSIWLWFCFHAAFPCPTSIVHLWTFFNQNWLIFYVVFESIWHPSIWYFVDNSRVMRPPPSASIANEFLFIRIICIWELTLDWLITLASVCHELYPFFLLFFVVVPLWLQNIRFIVWCCLNNMSIV